MKNSTFRKTWPVYHPAQDFVVGSYCAETINMLLQRMAQCARHSVQRGITTDSCLSHNAILRAHQYVTGLVILLWTYVRIISDVEAFNMARFPAT